VRINGRLLINKENGRRVCGISAQQNFTKPYAMTTLPDWIIWRAGGRRRYNAERKRAQAQRRRIVASLIDDEYQADIARLLGVHRSTICRDVAAIGSKKTQAAHFNMLKNERGTFE
jgi:hypothetical protein